MPNYVCYFHIVWTTKYRLPLISPDVEKLLFKVIRHKCDVLRCTVLALNGVSDHVHLAVNIPPTIAPSKFVADIKGTTSRRINTSFIGNEPFRWQRGYSIHTFGERALDPIVQYIENQKFHHHQGTLNNYLEQLDSIDDPNTTG